MQQARRRVGRRHPQGAGHAGTQAGTPEFRHEPERTSATVSESRRPVAA